MAIRPTILSVVLPVLMMVSTVAAPGFRAHADDVGVAFDAQASSLHALYKQLHAHPELSYREAETAKAMAAELRASGFTVTTGFGGHGVVGILKTGPGPTLLVRTDMDALPVEERSGVPYASRVTTPDPSDVPATGKMVSVMHACGHDLHMATWVGTARVLAGLKSKWSGTLMMIAQPAEEVGGGARAMLKAGLLGKFPRPDHAIALHTSPQLAAGTVGFTSGFALANVDSVDITVHGKGGHGAYPHKTVDPVVIAARIVMALQTIVAREIDPIESAVVTVGSIHGGTKSNIIPDTVRLQLTVRSYKNEIRQHLLAAIERIATAEAAAAAAPRKPDVRVSKEDTINATFNDPALSSRVATSLRAAIGAKNVRELPPSMGGEDFSEFGRAGVPAFIYWLGAVDPGTLAKAEKAGTSLPSLHSALFAPAFEPALSAGVRTMVRAALDLLAAR